MEIRKTAPPIIEDPVRPSRTRLALNKIGLGVERVVSRIGSSGFVFDETTIANEALSLAPVSMPEDGAGKLLYNIAYGPMNGTHPLRDVAKTLFNRKGVIPSGIQNESEAIRLQGVIETTPNGNITSTPVFEAYKRQAVDVRISKESRDISPVALGKMRLKQVYR